jgi:type II secretory ATPase GspE/PulE/Tfp pilus assembly ATPase PilB-like protein
MGIQPYLVFSSLTAVLAQRLIRRLCPQCKRPAKVDEAHRLLLGIESVPRDATIFEPVGCAQCNNLGYKGRIAVYELLEITPEIKSLSKEGLTSEEITRVASQQGFVTLRESAIENLFRGLTGTEEILRLTVE